MSEEVIMNINIECEEKKEKEDDNTLTTEILKKDNDGGEKDTTFTEAKLLEKDDREKEKPTEQNIVNVSNVDNKNPLTVQLDKEDDNTLTTEVLKKENDGGAKDTTFTEAKLLEKDAQEKEKPTEKNIEEKIIETDNDISATLSNTNEKENTVTAENKKERDNNKLTINVIRMIKVEYESSDEDTTFTDDNSQELELDENVIKDALTEIMKIDNVDNLYDNEEKSENDADKNSDEREEKLVEYNDNSEEDIPKKRKNDDEKGPQKRTKSH